MLISGFTQICYFSSDDDETFILLRKNMELPKEALYLKISAKDNTFQWIDKLKESRKASKDIVLVSENEPENGLLGFINCVRKEKDLSNIRCVLIDDVAAPAFAKDVALYEQKLRLGLAINVFKEVRQKVMKLKI